MIIQELASAEKASLSAIKVAATIDVPDLADDVCRHLLSPPHTLPAKYFYDHRGSKLFEQICNTAEYYPTRTEAALLQRYSQHIMNAAAFDNIIELGSGSSRKTRYLLDACQYLNIAPQYFPFDVCEPMLIETAEDLMQQYPWLRVQPLEGDYSAGLNYLPKQQGSSLYVFLGSSIGNFTEPEAVSFLQEIRQQMQPGDRLLLGVDRVKSESVLEAAYNDQQGLTAAFNKNVLAVLNKGAGADFDLAEFTHEAIYNKQQSQIEMYLQAKSDQCIQFAKLKRQLDLQQGARIRTEISRKYTLDGIESLLQQAKLTTIEHFEPSNEYFSLILAEGY